MATMAEAAAQAALALDAPADTPVRVVSFNVLAPCYGRLPQPLRRDGPFGRFESARPELFERRHRAILGELQALACDLLCLQEYWFDGQLASLYDEALDPYEKHMWQRPRKEDGLAVLVKRDRFRSVASMGKTFHHMGTRGILMVLVEPLAADPAAPPGRPLVLANTHLTFPHEADDRVLRFEQVERALAALDEFVTQQHLADDVTVLLAGDFNGDLEDPTYRRLVQAGFTSAFAVAHEGTEVGHTHCNHEGHNVGVDFVWMATAAVVRAAVASSAAPVPVPAQFTRQHVREACLLPRAVPDTASISRPDFGYWEDGAGAVPHEAAASEAPLAAAPPSATACGDGDAVAAMFTHWCNMSDHRPLVVLLEGVV